jgi:membrane-associated phospholipid phosphatase
MMTTSMQLHPGAARRRALVAMATLLAACSDATGPSAATQGATVTLAWNAQARQLVSALRESPLMASRSYAALSVAQYDAVAAVNARIGLFDASRPDAHRIAIAAASRDVLSELYPVVALELREMFEEQRAGFGADGTPVDVLARAEDAGASAARAVMERVSRDGSDAVWEGEVPTGEGLWSSFHPQLPLWGQVRPWIMESGSQFRAPPPPAFRSRQFKAALAEVRTISDARTEEQRAIAIRWSDGLATYTPPGHWNEIAAGLLETYRLGESEAAHVLATLNMAMMDAMIACWDSKFTYWLIRPWQADPEIATIIGQPPHPSYPSGHSCSSGAGAAVLGAYFLPQRPALDAMEREAGMSRVYAGLHYRFDVDAGNDIGRAVGAMAFRNGPDGRR